MYEIVIKLPGKPETTGKLMPGTYRIGSSPAAHIQIELPEVSNRHAALIVRENQVLVEDLGSTNGTRLDEKPVSGGPVTVRPGGVIHIGQATITVRDKVGVDRAVKMNDTMIGAELSRAKHDPAVSSHAATPSQRINQSAAMLLVSGIPYEYRKVVQQLKREVHEELLKRMNLKNLTLSGANAEEVRRQAGETVRAILLERRDRIPAAVKMDVLQEELVNEAVALGPLEGLLANPDVTEIMANGSTNIYVEMKGTLHRTDHMFADDDQLLTVIERIVAPLGRRIDESQPLVDARLPDGSRVNAIIPPLAIDGPTLTIRKFSSEVMTADMLIGFGSMNQEMAEFLRLAVLLRKNILISGGTGSGKTTLLNMLSNFLPNTDRIVTIEDAAELKLQKDHVVRLESRPPNIEGRGAIAIRDLVRNSLRMRPDRIVVGECRGGEALDMLQAMNTGHDGSLTTVHANSPRDALSRLETLVLMAGFDLPLRAIREQITSAIALIVHISRMKDGTRKVRAITEVTGMETDVITTQEIFEFEPQGLDENGKVLGRHKASGVVPTFIDEMQSAGVPFDIGIFNDGQ